MKPSSGSIPKPLLQDGQGQALYALLQQLNESQWWNAEQLARGQLQQLKKLIGYAIAHSPFYKQHLRDVDLNNLDLNSINALPLLTRAQLQENNGNIDCSQLPETHGVVSESMTSGSTGIPVKLRSTALTSTLWNAINMREQLWHKRQMDKVSASIRWHGEPIGLPPDGVHFTDWGLPVNLFFKTAASYFLNSSSAITAQLQWLQKIQPGYLMTHPSNLRALLQQMRQDESELDCILQVRTVGESISDDLRSSVIEQLNAKLVDLYSSEELGYIAIQCPLHDHYHIQSESVLVEVLREDGSACDLNESGKIVVSSLRNYATPLIRYEIGDYGELSEPCPCGRGLPVMKRIHGRVRNMLTHPDGSKHWPNFGFRKFMQVANIKQFQVVQHGLSEIELKLVLDSVLSAEQEAAIKNILSESLGHPFDIDISYHSSLTRSNNGKFEDFISLLAAKGQDAN